MQGTGRRAIVPAAGSVFHPLKDTPRSSGVRPAANCYIKYTFYPPLRGKNGGMPDYSIIRLWINRLILYDLGFPAITPSSIVNHPRQSSFVLVNRQSPSAIVNRQSIAQCALSLEH
jgi:hypothetical protein